MRFLVMAVLLSAFHAYGAIPEVKDPTEKVSVLCWVCCGNNVFDLGPVETFAACDKNGQVCDAATGKKFYNSVAQDPIPDCPFAE